VTCTLATPATPFRIPHAREEALGITGTGWPGWPDRAYGRRYTYGEYGAARHRAPLPCTRCGRIVAGLQLVQGVDDLLPVLVCITCIRPDDTPQHVPDLPQAPPGFPRSPSAMAAAG
jgi:hypothetical protein